MFRSLGVCFATFVRVFCSQKSLLLENLALRQQLSVLKRRHPRSSSAPQNHRSPDLFGTSGVGSNSTQGFGRPKRHLRVIERVHFQRYFCFLF